MDPLEKFIKDNKELFMDQEPSPGHLERFEQKLKKGSRRTKVIQMTRRVSRIAAISLLAIMSGLWIYSQFGSTKEGIMSLSDVNPEMQDVEFFYTSQIDSYCNELKSNDLIKGTAYGESMETELSEMDSVYAQLQKELGANPNDERIIQAMIRHYQTKLEVLKEILQRLDQIQKMNISNSNNQNQYESVTL